MAGNSFMVTVSAPKAPCTQTHTSVTSGHTNDTDRRLRSIQLTSASYTPGTIGTTDSQAQLSSAPAICQPLKSWWATLQASTTYINGPSRVEIQIGT